MTSTAELPPASLEHSSTSGATPQALVPSLTCGSCNKAISNQYVRALGSIYHANCFRCLDCNEIVTAKFFSFKPPDGKTVPLCEVDYFRRLDLLCAKCGQALRGSYITATDKKYHVNHFTCSCCSTLFGAQDSYYEHQNTQGVDVYCHYHYSTRCAQKCASCQTAILRQYVEVNRSSRDEAYHLPCHLIQKFWNVKIQAPLPPQIGNAPPWQEEEKLYTPGALKDAQKQMDELVHRIWTVLSAYEESSAACISDLLKSVSNVIYLEAIRSAERFIFHVEVLFAALDDLEFRFEAVGAAKGISHVRESRVLCRKTVDLFTQLSHTQKDISRQGITQDLLSLITGIAHYLKILLRLALLGALRLRREYNDESAMTAFLDQLRHLMEENGDPLANRKSARITQPASNVTRPRTSLELRAGGQVVKGARSREGVAFGFKSLDPEISGHSPYAQEYLDVKNGTRLAADFVPPSDLCIKCNNTIENGCIRLGTYSRWHLHCLACDVCGRAAAAPPPQKGDSKSSVRSIADTEKDEDSHEESEATRKEIRKKLQERLDAEAAAESYSFILDPEKTMPPGLFVSPEVPAKIFCTAHRTGESHLGFSSVSRLEQYSYLLNVALLRLYSILKRRGAIHPPTDSIRRKASSPRESMELTRLKTVSLDRQNTAMKTPRRLTIIESPVGNAAQATSIAVTSVDPFKSPPKKAQKPSTPPSPTKRTKPSTPPSPSRKGPEQSTSNDTDKPTRPGFTRMNSQVAIMEDAPVAAPLPQPDHEFQTLDKAITEEPEEDMESLKLADIQSLVEAEQAKDRRSSILSSGSSGLGTPYLSDLEPLDTVIVKHAALWLLNHSELKDKFDADDVLESIAVGKGGGMWKNFFKSEKKVKKKGVFGVPLDLLTEREGVSTSLGVNRNGSKIPAFMDDILSAMKQMDVSIEGIFRKNGNIRRLKEAIEALDRDGGNYDFSQENPIQLAALLKKFLNDLPDPLLTYRLHTLFLAIQSVSNPAERTRLLHLACTLLPKSHRSTMEALFAFLKWVAMFANIDSVGSKMDVPNLAIVVAPSILSAKNSDPQREQSFTAIAVVTQMLEEQDLFNRVPDQCLQFLAHKQDLIKCANESSKDLLKKCHQHYTGTSSQSVKSPLTSPVTVQFAPNTLHTQRSDNALDYRGRASGEKKPVRDSKSLERNRERSNTLRKPKPGLPHSPFSMPVGVGGGPSQKLLAEPTPLSLGALSAAAPIDPPASAPPIEPTPETNGHSA